jgi:hypothetical protein
LTSQGKSAIDAIRSIGVTDATYYRWRQEYGGLKVDQVKRLKELEPATLIDWLPAASTRGFIVVSAASRFERRATRPNKSSLKSSN